MNPVALSDALATLGFGLALLFVVLVPVDPGRSYLRPVKAFAIAAMALYVFVGVSNILEWSGVTGVMDAYEDYAEVLFIPLVAYVVLSLATAQQLEDARRDRELISSQNELLSSIVDTSPAGVLVVEPGGSVSFANDQAEDYLGLRRADVASRHEPRGDVRLSPEAGGVIGVTEALRDLVQRGRDGRVVRFAEHPGGRTIALDVRTKSLGGAPPGSGPAVVAFVDMTDQLRYRLELEEAVDARTRELIELNRRLEVANDAKREFLTKMSHELRTPLNSIIGFTATLLQGYAGELSGEQRRQLETIRGSSRQLLSLVDGVLDISLIESGRHLVTFAPVEMCGFIADLRDAMAPLAVEGEIDFECECPLDIGEVITDSDKLAQVARCLVTNAFKFSSPGGWVRMTVAAEGRNVCLTIADSGIGIAASDLESIFEPFTQLPGPDGAMPSGTGLGLSICRDLVGMLGGTIAVRSEPGTGSSFAVTLPRKPARAPIALPT